VVEEVSPLPPLVSEYVTRRNTTKALQTNFRRLEEIYGQKRRVGNVNCSVSYGKRGAEISFFPQPLLLARYIIPFLTGLYLLRETTF